MSSGQLADSVVRPLLVGSTLRSAETPALLAGRVGPRPEPTHSESPFDIDEIFFSTTDREGLIRSGNRVFARVSGYSRSELVGSPHSIVRHPDMPRCIFNVFWEELEAGRPIAVYVKNMARNG